MGGVRHLDHQVYDVLVIGGGPAGLTAALNLVTEGRSVVVVDGACECGGQARHALRVVNLFGVSGGVRGQTLVENTHGQIKSFGGTILLETEVVSLLRGSDRFIVTCRDGGTLEAQAVVIATGTTWRHLSVFDQYLERGVVYGSPEYGQHFDDQTVLVVGGGNSAGQAALHVAGRGAARVHLVMRCQLGIRMSDYLVHDIIGESRITVYEATEVETVSGADSIQVVALSSGVSLAVSAAYLLAGGTPNTACVCSFVDCDDSGHVITREDYVTSVPGVFAIGDARMGAVTRIQAATGDGAAVAPRVHRWLEALAFA